MTTPRATSWTIPLRTASETTPSHRGRVGTGAGGTAASLGRWKRRNAPLFFEALPGPLAQLVEQGTLNPKVEGSNPSRPMGTVQTVLSKTEVAGETRSSPALFQRSEARIPSRAALAARPRVAVAVWHPRSTRRGLAFVRDRRATESARHPPGRGGHAAGEKLEP